MTKKKSRKREDKWGVRCRRSGAARIELQDVPFSFAFEDHTSSADRVSFPTVR